MMQLSELHFESELHAEREHAPKFMGIQLATLRLCDWDSPSEHRRADDQCFDGVCSLYCFDTIHARRSRCLWRTAFLVRCALFVVVLGMVAMGYLGRPIPRFKVTERNSITLL